MLFKPYLHTRTHDKFGEKWVNPDPTGWANLEDKLSCSARPPRLLKNSRSWWRKVGEERDPFQSEFCNVTWRADRFFDIWSISYIFLTMDPKKEVNLWEEDDTPRRWGGDTQPRSGPDSRVNRPSQKVRVSLSIGSCIKICSAQNVFFSIFFSFSKAVSAIKSSAWSSHMFDQPPSKAEGHALLDQNFEIGFDFRLAMPSQFRLTGDLKSKVALASFRLHSSGKPDMGQDHAKSRWHLLHCD